MLKSLLELQPFHFMGRISFSLYLLHLPLIYSLGCYVFIKSRNHGMAAFPSFAWSASATIIASIVLAALMTFFIDEPAMALVKRWYDRYFQPLFVPAAKG